MTPPAARVPTPMVLPGLFTGITEGRGDLAIEVGFSNGLGLPAPHLCLRGHEEGRQWQESDHGLPLSVGEPCSAGGGSR